MVKIGSTPPFHQPSEPNKPKKPKKKEAHEAHRAHSKEPKGSRKKQLQRFAKAHPPPASVEQLRAEHKGSKSSDFSVNVPYRYQWENNGGYCGECCTIASGMMYGQWMSQFDAREMAWSETHPKDRPPGGDQQCQLLLGVNDKATATKMHLNSITYPGDTSGTTTQDFLVWVKQMVSEGYPTTIGLFMNENYFYGKSDPTAGDTEYDHIVSVTKVVSKYNDGKYHGDDVIYFSDNGLNESHGGSGHIFSMTFDQLQATRQQANKSGGQIYSLRNDGDDYCIAITGIMGQTKDMPSVRVDTSRVDEDPPIDDKSTDRPTPENLSLTVTLTGLKPNVKYYLYRYDDVDKVPNSSFNAHDKDAYEKIPIEITSGSTYVIHENITSDQQVFYRAVPADDPNA